MKLSPMSILYLILSVSFGILCTVKFDEIAVSVVKQQIEYGFFVKILGFITMTVLGYIGALVGDFIRSLAIPDAIYTDGSMFTILKEKFFWFIVPQLVGILIGAALGGSMIMKLFQ